MADTVRLPFVVFHATANEQGDDPLLRFFSTDRKRGWVLVTVASMISLLSLVPPSTARATGATDDPGNEAPPAGSHAGNPAAVQTIDGAQTLVAVTGQTSFYVDQAGTGVYRVDSGFDLDQYLFRNSSPLDYSIDVAGSFGPVDADGHPLPGHAFYGKEGRLTLRVFDVDDDYAGGTYAAEYDQVVVNGTVLPGYLSGADSQWSINTFRVPLNLLRFPTASNPTGRNNFQVLIDTANGGLNVWAVEVAWSELRLSSDVLPLAMIHGFGGSSDDFRLMQLGYERNYPALLDRIARPALTRRDSIEANRALMEQPIADLLQRSGAYNLNILAHSMGGLDSRLYAWDHPAQVRKLVMLGTPNGGTRIADIVCGAATPGIFAGIGGAVVRNRLRSLFGPCDGPEDGLYQLQQHYVQDIFNKQVPDRASTFMATIAGKGNDPRNILIDGEDDGLISVASVEYLSMFNGDHPGFHVPRGVFNVNHSALLSPDSPSAPRSLCTLYTVTCGTALSSSAGGSSSSTTPAVGALEAVIGVGEPGQVAGVTVPAGGSTDLALNLEGGPQAGVMVLASGPVVATVGTTPLTVGSMFGSDVLGAVVSTTAGSTLHVVNNGADPVEVAVLVAVQSSRRLTVNASPVLAEAGQPVSVTASLSEADAGDAPRAIVTDGTGSVVADFALGSVGGVWGGEFTPPGAGSYSVSVVVVGNRPRYATDTVTVSSGAARLTGVATTSVRDDNANGLWDALDAQVSLNVTTPGAYRVAAHLLDSSGATVATAGARAILAAGARTMTVSFDGQDIYASGRSGPYRVANLVLSRDDAGMALEHTLATGVTTASYDYRSFEHFAVNIDLDGFSDGGVDVDGDDRFDRLDVTGRVSVDTGGSYAVNARLVAANGTELGEFQTTTSFVSGSNGFTLSFPWAAIRAAGFDGPYAVEDLSIYPLSNSDVLGYLVVAHHTAAYPASGEVGTITFARLRAMLDMAAANGGVSGAGLIQSLVAKLDAAEAAYNRGNVNTARNNLEAFRSELWAQRGKHVTEATYVALDAAAEQLANSL